MVLKNRERFFVNPGSRRVALEKKIKERLHWEEGALWSLEDLHARWPWGHNRSLKRQALMWARVHRSLRSDAPDLALVRGLVAQAVEVTFQAAYDSGNYDLAWTFFPEEDPVQANVRDAMPPPMHAADPFMILAEPQELSAGMSYIRDVASLNRARAERFKNHPGAQTEEKPEKPPGAPKAKDKGGKPNNKGGEEEGA